MFIPIQSLPDPDSQRTPPPNSGVVPPAPSLRKKAKPENGTAGEYNPALQQPHPTATVANNVLSGTDPGIRIAVRHEMAPRSLRLNARLIDGGIGVFIYLVLVFAGGAAVPSALAFLGMLAFIAYQVYLLTTAGQTIGKRAMNIKIVKCDTGENGGFITNALLREIVNSILTIVPFYFLVDILFIFRDDQRCIHDFIAGTQVVMV